MKSKNGTFVYNHPYILSRGKIFGVLNSMVKPKSKILITDQSVVFIDPNTPRELADFIEELQKQKD